MPTLFSALTHAVEKDPAIALGAAILWGMLSVLLSPCHLASIPLIVGFVDRQGKISTGRSFLLALLFASGIFITIGLIGAVTAATGRMLGDVGAYGNYFVAGLFFLVALHLLDVIPMPFTGPGQVNMRRKGYLAAFLLGLLFGVALGPCTFAYMAPMLGVAFRMAEDSPLYSTVLLLAYGAGHCAVIVAAGTSTGWVQRFLDWNNISHGALWLRRICGLLVWIGGLWMVYSAP